MIGHWEQWSHVISENVRFLGFSSFWLVIFTPMSISSFKYVPECPEINFLVGLTILISALSHCLLLYLLTGNKPSLVSV